MLSLEDETTRSKSIEREKQSLQSDIDKLQKEVTKSKPDGHSAERNAKAQELWEKHLAGKQSESFEEAWTSIDPETTPEVRELLKVYRKRVEDQRAHWARWESTQTVDLIQPWNDFQKRPWDEERKRDANEQLAALVNAREIWVEVLGRKKSTWEEFKGDLKVAADANKSSDRIRGIVSTWIDQFNGITGPDKNVTVLLKSGKSPAGSGTYRTVDIHIAGSYLPLDDENGSDWKVETAHTYDPPLAITFSWRPDQSIQFKVFGERQTLRVGIRPAYIDQKWFGPVALWELARDGQIKTGNHTIALEVKGLPGPPPSLPETVRAKELLP